MYRMKKASPLVPTEIHIHTVADDRGNLSILSIRTTEGILDIALDSHAADAVVSAIGSIRSKLGQSEILKESTAAKPGRESIGTLSRTDIQSF